MNLIHTEGIQPSFMGAVLAPVSALAGKAVELAAIGVGAITLKELLLLAGDSC